MELAWARRSGQVSLLALDWKKAFDSISPQALLIALRRFGLPSKYVDIIGSIYADRKFRVKSGTDSSSERLQNFGISQGCPLITLFIRDAYDHYHGRRRE